MEESLTAGAGEVSFSRSADCAGAEVRAERAGVLRSGQDVDGSGRRYRGNDRLPRILRARNVAIGRAAKAGADARRAQLPGLYSAGRGRDHSAVEFSMRDHGGNDGGIAGYGKYGGAEAGGGLADYRGKIHRHPF